MSYTDYQEVKAAIMEAAQEVENLRIQVRELQAENARLREALKTLVDTAVPPNDKYRYNNGMTAGQLREQAAICLEERHEK